MVYVPIEMSNGQKIDLNVSCDDTISELKAKISKETGISIDEIHRFFHKGIVLTEGNSLESYGIQMYEEGVHSLVKVSIKVEIGDTKFEVHVEF
jgi:predicted RNase H-related nuclease YkuK (DUF458 family)